MHQANRNIGNIKNIKNLKNIRNIIIILILTASMIFHACGKQEEEIYTELPVENIAAAIIKSQDGMPVLYGTGSGTEAFDSCDEIYLGNSCETVDEAIICSPDGVDAREIAVFRFRSEYDAKAAEQALKTYIKNRVSTFSDYAPEQAAIAEKGTVVIKGRYAALLICPDIQSAREIFLSCFSENPPTVQKPDEYYVNTGLNSTQNETPAPTLSPEEGSDIYDRDAVLKAWSTKDTSSLTDKNLELYNVCQNIIDTYIKDGMSTYEKELAIHDYIIENIAYDEAVLSHISEIDPDPDNNNPYGALVHGKAICLGYSESFGLLMDMLGIECTTVRGYSEDGEDHAWNMVRIDGDWYCVDVTWDDPISSYELSAEVKHRYFNVTSEYMRDTGHEWDEINVPEALGTQYGWRET